LEWVASPRDKTPNLLGHLNGKGGREAIRQSLDQLWVHCVIRGQRRWESLEPKGLREREREREKDQQ
jgi:hypothetical protein